MCELGRPRSSRQFPLLHHGKGLTGAREREKRGERESGRERGEEQRERGGV